MATILAKLAATPYADNLFEGVNHLDQVLLRRHHCVDVLVPAFLRVSVKSQLVIMKISTAETIFQFTAKLLNR